MNEAAIVTGGESEPRSILRKQEADQASRVLGVTNFMSVRKAKQAACEDTLSVHFTTRCSQTLLSVGFLEQMSQERAIAVREYFLFHDPSGQRPVSRESWQNIFQKAGYTPVDEDHIEFARMSIFSIK